MHEPFASGNASTSTNCRALAVLLWLITSTTAIAQVGHGLDRDQLRSQLVRHEGKRDVVYRDSLGVPTIGVGFNLTRPDAKQKIEAIGLNYDRVLGGSQAVTDEQIGDLLEQDIDASIADARSLFDNFDELSDVRQRVLVDMCFNLGKKRLSAFKKMVAAVEAGNFSEAAAEMKDSKWYTQVKTRGVTLATMMETDEDPSWLQDGDFGNREPAGIESQPEGQQPPRAVIVLIHGVDSGADAYAPFKERIRPLLGSVWVLEFDWGRGQVLSASDSVGDRNSLVFGMSDFAWQACDRLTDILASCRAIVGTETKIVVLSHSQGSVITLAAFQEGSAADAWVLMGSPLDKEIVREGGINTKFSVASRQVSGPIVNLWSPDDNTVRLKGGIGAFGMPQKIAGIDGQFRNGSLGNITDIQVQGVDHFQDADGRGNPGWWTMTWLLPDAKQVWTGPLDRGSFLRILDGDSLGQQAPAESEEFQALNRSAKTAPMAP